LNYFYIYNVVPEIYLRKKTVWNVLLEKERRGECKKGGEKKKKERENERKKKHVTVKMEL
jgi:hypothetical protein